MGFEAWKDMGAQVVATSPFSEKIFDFIPAGGAVLDLGCGNGRISKIIKNRGYQTFGIDINAEAIRFAQSDAELNRIEFSVRDSKKTDFQDGFFDAVIEQATLACMERGEREATLKEIYRILKPGGTLSVAEFGIKPGKEEKYKIDADITGEYGTRIIKRKDGSEWFRSHNFAKEELEGLIKNVGFEMVWEAPPDFYSLAGNAHPGHQYVAKKTVICESVPMKALGIDYGTKRIGVAVSDDTGSLAFPLAVVESGPKALEEVANIARVNNVEQLVIGESLNFKGEPNEV